jgi:hypothetical protein
MNKIVQSRKSQLLYMVKEYFKIVGFPLLMLVLGLTIKQGEYLGYFGMMIIPYLVIGAIYCLFYFIHLNIKDFYYRLCIKKIKLTFAKWKFSILVFTRPDRRFKYYKDKLNI